MNMRLTIMLVTVLVIFGGTFLIVRFTGSDAPREDPPWLYKIDDDDIIQIEASSEGKTVIYAKKQGSNDWFIQDDPEVPVFLDKWSGTTLLLSGPQVNRVLPENMENLEVYGLDPPKTRIKVMGRNNLGYELHLGNKTPDGENQYARLASDPSLFTVVEIWAQVVNRLATEPPYPPSLEEEPAAAGSG